MRTCGRPAGPSSAEYNTVQTSREPCVNVRPMRAINKIPCARPAGPSNVTYNTAQTSRERSADDCGQIKHRAAVARCLHKTSCLGAQTLSLRNLASGGAEAPDIILPRRHSWSWHGNIVKSLKPNDCFDTSNAGESKIHSRSFARCKHIVIMAHKSRAGSEAQRHTF